MQGKRTQARSALILTSVIWGTTFPISRVALADTDPVTLLLLRCGIAALPFLPLAWRNRDLRTMLAGAELGIWMWAALATQAVGLTSTTAGRSAFITSLSVILVALGEGLVLDSARRQTWVAVLLAVAGITLLTYDGGAVGAGDAWTLLCAVLYAGLILRMSVHATRVEVLPFVAWQLVVAAAASCGWVAVAGPVLTNAHSVPWVAAAYLGLAATLLTTVLQTYGQRDMEAAESAIIFSLEPVWALAIGCAFLGEPFGVTVGVGGLLVVVACVVCQLPEGRRAAIS